MISNKIITELDGNNNNSKSSIITHVQLLSLNPKINNRLKLNKYRKRYKLLKYIFVLILILILFQNFKIIISLLKLGLKPINNPIVQYNQDVKIEKDIDKIIINGNSRKLNWKNVRRDFNHLVHKYKYLMNNETNIPEDSPIFMMWYQGINKAPRIVKVCFQSVLEKREKHPLILLDKYNLGKYLKLPGYIFHKFKKRKISFQQFSDIVRTGLLARHGGYWIDSTYYINTLLKKVNTTFVTIKPKYCFLRYHPFIKCLFSVNFLGVPKNSFIASFNFASLLFYWKKYNRIIDYFLLDFIFDIAYKKVPRFKTIIKRHPKTKCGIFALNKKNNRIYNPLDLRCEYNKLKKNKKYKAYKNGNIKNFGYLARKYRFNYSNYFNIFKGNKTI